MAYLMGIQKVAVTMLVHQREQQMAVKIQLAAQREQKRVAETW